MAILSNAWFQLNLVRWLHRRGCTSLYVGFRSKADID